MKKGTMLIGRSDDGQVVKSQSETKITKQALVCVAWFRRKIGTKRRGVFLPSPVIKVVR